MKEKYIQHNINSNITIQESKIYSYNKIDNIATSHRIHRDGYVGAYFHEGICEDEYAYTEAEKRLELKRPYPFELETGVRKRNKVEQILTEKELMELARECLTVICTKYPNFTFSGSFSQSHNSGGMTNEKGLDYQGIDCAVSASITYKHKDSKDIMDGGFSMSLRTFDKNIFLKMADDYLANHETIVELPEELIIQTQYYGYLGVFQNHLDGENLALGTSLLSGKIRQKLFSEEFTLEHNVTDKECWFSSFWDGDGCVNPDDRYVYIQNGVVLSGYADKKTAAKYNIPHTNSAACNYNDIPYNGLTNLFIPRSEKTIKELLNGRMTVIPVNYSGGGYNEQGDYVMPVHLGLLCDGEKVIGRVPPFVMKSNFYDMFGKDFIGVGKDQPIFNDKQILMRMQYSK